MLHTHDAISHRGGRRFFRSTVLAVLTMAAMLLCLLAVHSAGTGHGLSAAPATTTAGSHSAAAHAASSAAPLPGTVLERIAPATTTVVAVAVAVGTISSANTHALSGLATLSMTCPVLLVLVGLILLSRRPSAFRRLLEACGYTVGSFREIPLHLHRPSLTLLSISRI